MKNLKIQLMLIIVFVNFASCADFLEETPTTQLDGSKIYNTEVSALSALAGCYANMANAYGYHFYHVHTVSSGLGVSLKAIDLALTSMNIATNDTHVNNMYSAFYKVINSANDILEGVENAQLEEGTIKNKILGEAYLARAISYFNLVRSFGKVPLVTNVITSYEGTGMPRSEVKDVYRLIITDLTKAFELLPEPGDQDMGRPHKYAAKAVLAKVYVTMAGTDDTSEYWQTAYDAALEVKKMENIL